MTLPKLIVFDLDFTLWDAGGVWCDCLSPPFRERAGRVEHTTRLVTFGWAVLVGLPVEDHRATIALADAFRASSPNIDSPKAQT